jgi:hypothetical protein
MTRRKLARITESKEEDGKKQRMSRRKLARNTE